MASISLLDGKRWDLVFGRSQVPSFDHPIAQRIPQKTQYVAPDDMDNPESPEIAAEVMARGGVFVDEEAIRTNPETPQRWEDFKAGKAPKPA